MCGICGVVTVDPERPVEIGRIESMLSRLAHRGPDGEGMRTARGVAFGHRRLAIIDLSEAAAQPLPNEDGSLLSIVNGEIYNHRELRCELEGKGHRFRSRCDCEVLVHLYEEEGPSAVSRLDGMFAFAIWDGPRDRLVLGRDRMGEKPLYYHEDRSRIVFASELAALLADPDLDPVPDDEAIRHYLTYRYVPGPGTGLRGVRKLLPGHLLVWERGRGRIERYGRIPRPAEARAELAGAGLGPADWTEPDRVRGAIGRAVAGRLEADVPVGVLLSGGIDSAIVAYEAARARGGAIETFTVGFEEADYDESAAASLVAARIGAKHHAIRVRPDLAAELPRMAIRYGEPFGDSSAAAVWILAREVRCHVTVAIGGDGGDELFGGYDRHRAIRLLAGLRRTGAARLLPLARRLAAGASFTRARRDRLTRLERFVRAASTDPREANGEWLTCFSDAEKRALYGERLAEGAHMTDSLDLLRSRYRRTEDPLEDVLHVDLSLGLPDDLLFKVDIAAMASGLEVRSPLLSRDLVRLAAAIPVRRKIGLRQGKMILRRAYAGVLPESTLAARKAGFGLPVDRWLRGPLREMTHDVLLTGKAVSEGYVRKDGVAELLRAHDSGAANHDDRIWALLCLELWLRMVVAGEGGAAEGSSERDTAVRRHSPTIPAPPSLTMPHLPNGSRS